MISLQWLYDGAADVWGEFLDANANATLRYGGYYIMRLESSLLVIALNMNFGDDENWWLLVDPVDPGGMLQWLSNQLQTAEDNGDKVFFFIYILHFTFYILHFTFYILHFTF
jgi:sphingomyelin phosphodiesterase